MVKSQFAALLGLLVMVLLALPVFAQQAPAAHMVVLPLERTNYFVGENIPLAVSNAKAPYQLSLIDAAGQTALAAKRGTTAVWRLETGKLAPGQYTVAIDGQPTGVTIGLTSPLRPSCAALTDEWLPWPNSPAERAALRDKLRESGVNAVMADGQSEIGRYTTADALAEARTMFFLNPYTRPMSFNGARVYAPELQTYRHRLALCAQANGRYPTFGGYYYDWDPVGPFGRDGLLIYWNWNDQTAALRNYISRSNQAIYDQFTARTGLKAPTQTEYIQYCISIGHPEFAPAFDLPTYKWIMELGKTMKPLPKDELAALEKRIDAWSSYLMGLYGENYAGHNTVVHDTIPSLRNTTSLNIDHCAVKGGQWHPDAYAPLDFRYITAWNDQIAGPDYTFQWLFSAGILDMGRKPDQPTWVGSSLGTVDNLANYPGKFLRMAGHNLAYGGRGLGFALEGFSTVLGGMNGETYWQNIKGKSGGEDLIAGREFLNRFAPLSAACTDVRTVGILYSKWQMGRQYLAQGMDTPQYNAFTTLARLGYTPRFITEDEILAGGLNSMKTLVVVNQNVALPADVLTRLAAFTRTGGRILRDKSSTVELPKAEIMDIAMPYARPGKPHNWGSPSITRTPHAILGEQRYAELAPAMLQALGNATRTPLVAKSGAGARVSTFALNGGADAVYVVAVDDAVKDNQSDWLRLDEELLPNGVVKGALYDLTAEKALGAVAPVTCRFQDLTARLYGVLARPVKSIDLRANQTVTGGSALIISMQFIATDGKPLKAAIPFYLTLARPDGTVEGEYYRATDIMGNCLVVVPMGSNATPGTWTIAARSLLDGMTATLPVTVKAGKTPAPQPVEENVIVRGGEQLKALLAKKPALVLPVFNTPAAPVLVSVAEEAKKSLAAQGISVDVRVNPTVSTYLMAYDPDAAAQAENARAERGETIGKMRVTTVNRNDYFGTLSGYIFGKPVILLDLVGTKDANGKPVASNEMTSGLSANGMLWPAVSDVFPGKGKATVQIVKNAFQLGVDAIVVQATDPEGLLAGVRALNKLPADWITPGVEGARATLLQQFSIGKPTAAFFSGIGFTANGLKTGSAPQPLALKFPGAQPPLAAEVKPFAPEPYATHILPATLAAADLVTYYQIDGKFMECSTPGGNWPGDTRFQDAVLIKVDAGAGGQTSITLDGVFRYSDRKPTSQSTWEELLALYNAQPHPRLPQAFDVYLDGKLIGSLTTVATGEKEVSVQLNPPQSAREEVAVRISGTVPLPAGVHELLLAHKNIVDGKIEKVTIGK